MGGKYQSPDMGVFTLVVLTGFWFCGFFFLLLYCSPSSPSSHGDVHSQPSVQFSILFLGSKCQEGMNWSVIYPTLWGSSEKQTDLVGGQ